MAYKLYKENIATNPTYQYVDEAVAPGGYIETNDPIDWDVAYRLIKQGSILTLFTQWRDKIATAYNAIGVPSDSQKKIASKWFVVNKSVRDTVHSAAEQEQNAMFVSVELEKEKEESVKTNTVDVIKNADVSIVDEAVAEISKAWKPDIIPLGTVLLSGATISVNDSLAGVYLTLSGAADDAFYFNDSLNKSGAVKYDGSDLKLRIHGRISVAGAGGDNIKLNVKYAFIKDGDNSATEVSSLAEQTVDISSISANINFDIDTNIMTGEADAYTIMIGVSRNGTGAGADTYAGDLEITAIELVKA